MHLPTLRTLLTYTDWSNDQLLDYAAPLTDEQLDRDMQIGPGAMRRTVLHIYNGERVWFLRWRDGFSGAAAEPPWPTESEKTSVAELRTRMNANRSERDSFLDQLASNQTDLSHMQVYRDSKGHLFRAKLADMIVQGVMHSKHHQAQAVNILRRLRGDGGTGGWPELDYMYRIRKAV